MIICSLVFLLLLFSSFINSFPNEHRLLMYKTNQLNRTIIKLIKNYENISNMNDEGWRRRNGKQNQENKKIYKQVRIVHELNFTPNAILQLESKKFVCRIPN